MIYIYIYIWGGWRGRVFFMIIWPWRAPHYFPCGGTCHHGPPPKLFHEGHLGTENISSSFSSAHESGPQFQHPWDPHGFSMDFPSGLAKECQTFCQMQQMLKNLLKFLSAACSCYPVDVSSCFKCQHPSELQWKSLQQWFWFSKPRNQSTGLMLSPDGQSPVFHITKILGLCCV